MRNLDQKHKGVHPLTTMLNRSRRGCAGLHGRPIGGANRSSTGCYVRRHGGRLLPAPRVPGHDARHPGRGATRLAPAYDRHAVPRPDADVVVRPAGPAGDARQHGRAVQQARRKDADELVGGVPTVAVAVTGRSHLLNLNVRLERRATGLEKPSVANVYDVQKVFRVDFVERVGSLPTELMDDLDAGLRLVLGL